MGSRGILPAAQLLDWVRGHVGPDRYLLLPTLAWLNASDGFLLFLCWGGAALAVVLFAGIAPIPVLALLWVFYLSIVGVGQVFLGYQWDGLLLEAGLLAILLAPPVWRSRPGRDPAPPWHSIWLMRWLLARLMFASGVGEAPERRRRLASLDGPPVPLRNPAASDVGRLVRSPVARLVPDALRRPHVRRRARRSSSRVRRAARAPRRSRVLRRLPASDRGHGQLRLLQPPDHRPLCDASRRRRPAAPLALARCAGSRSPLVSTHGARLRRAALRPLLRRLHREHRHTCAMAEVRPRDPGRGGPLQLGEQLRPVCRHDDLTPRDRGRGERRRSRLEAV